MNYLELDTPALLIDQTQLHKNIQRMQDYANKNKVNLRPHTKTHKMPEIALLQKAAGACGIAVAKVGEAEVMAKAGLTNILIANEIVGRQKLVRIKNIAKLTDIYFGIDSPEVLADIEAVFADAAKPAEVLIEIEVGENRSGVIEESAFLELLDALKKYPHIHLKGIFSHEGHSYSAANLAACQELFLTAQKRTLSFVKLAKANGFAIEIVSIGATPTLMNQMPLLDGITEIRPGTYILMDASQAQAVGTLGYCAASVLATVISKPTTERVILDVGAKGLTAQTRNQGICAVEGRGIIKGFDAVHIFAVYDEHAIIYNKAFHDAVKVGDKVEIIPVHICPVCNLYEQVYLLNNGEVIKEIPILCRGKLQ